MKSLLVICAFGILLGSPIAIAEEIRIAVVDMEKVFRGAPGHGHR